MKILKYLFFLILLVLIGGALYFGTKDGNFDIAESNIIKAPPAVIYDNVKDFKNWEQWGPWMAEDEDIEINYAEKTEGEGASYSWKSELMGDGSMETVKVIPNKSIEQKITFDTPLSDSSSDVYWYFENTENEGETKVTWGMKGEQSFLEKVFMGLFSDEDFETSLRTMYQNGLNKLEDVVLEEMKKFTVNVDGITQHGGGYYMYTTTSAKMNDIASRMGPMMGQVMSYMQQNNIAQSGMPFTIYNQIDNTTGNVIFSAAIPVRERIITPDGSPVVCGFMEPTTALKTTLRGDYSNLPAAYTKAQEYLAQNAIEVATSKNMFEVYATDPGEVPNPANWVTEVYIPVIEQTNRPE